ncbi:MAG: hypothetical protein M3525_14645 [Acidobacteriota bacterium]|nr:hypothetical protein [Acidobacteriota bacterium]
MNNNGNGQSTGKTESEQTELLTEEAEKLIRHVFDVPLETDKDLAALGEIYTD